MSPIRHAAIDVGTNTVLLLVAEERDGRLEPVVERAEITRLGRGVDGTGRLSSEAIRETVEALGRFAAEARALGAQRIVCVATSAARDAQNGAEFFAAARAAAGLTPEVITGDEEARLVYGSAWRDFGLTLGGPAPFPPGAPLAVLDVGGGSTEFTYGDGPLPRARTSLQVGAVRLTERHVRCDPIPLSEQLVLREAAREALAPIAKLDGLGDVTGARLIGVAGTVTTLCSVHQELPAYDAEKVHGATMLLDEIDALLARLAGLPIAERKRLPGMEPKRADVIVAGGIVVAEAMRLLGFDRLTVSDRGVRWGLLYDRLGAGG